MTGRSVSIARRRLRRRWPWIAGALVLASIGVADHHGLLLAGGVDDLRRYDGRRANVVRVLDGDTIEVDIRDSLHDRPCTRIRLIGIDCPETAGVDREAEPLADDARAFVVGHVDSGPVLLSVESHRTRGVYGRLLAHVETNDGIMLNQALLEAGLARVDDRWPHMRLRQYARAERNARRRQIGCWSTGERGRGPRQ